MGVLFWVAVILLILVVFLANRSRIQEVLDSTGLLTVIHERFSRKEEAQPESVPEESDVEVDTERPPVTQPPATRGAGDDGTPAAEPRPSQPDNERPEPEPPPADEAVQQRQDQQEETRMVVTSAEPPNQRRSTIYYIRVTEDGRVHPENVVRTVRYGTSPLTETIRTLLAGPTSGELDSGLLNLIPEGTELISARVENGVAYLNFNDNFRFNPMGLDGVVAQLKQIIYSSTEFPTVTRVQFLVEGQVLEYLGGEGVFVGAPLGRDAFS